MRKLQEFSENTTLKYYNENATTFSATTRTVDFSTTQDKFLALLQPNALILDFGCGTGRDTKYFMDHGYRVEATDGSEELCRLASTYAGVPVKHMLFQELDEQKKYDGMRRSQKNNLLLIVSDHTKSFYEDKWYGDVLYYTGMGKFGDQQLTSQNKTLAESNKNGVAIYLCGF